MISSPMESGIRAVSLVMGLGLFALLCWAALVSRAEGERSAARRLGIIAVVLPLPFLFARVVPGPPGEAAAWILVVASFLAAAVFLLPLSGRDAPDLGQPVPGVDERDIMFSRATLVPGTERFDEYYRSRPGKRALDQKFRAEPGLLSPGSAHFHPHGFAAADAAFWTIERLRPFVEGSEGVAGGEDQEAAGGRDASGPASPIKLGGESFIQTGAAVGSSDPEAVTRFLKSWTLKMGAHSVGVTELRDYHLYSHVGRGPDYGKRVDLDHAYALALTVEMDKEMVDRAPRAPTAMESAFQYLRGGVMAVQLADLIRRLGYRARAHVDGNYRVICPLVAKDAGLGEMGRMGLLMTPRLGPRVRIAVVTTDLPLAVDPPARDLTTVDFCLRCRKCADSCPSRAIPVEDPEEDEDGVLRWRIDAEACFALWGKLGTDCARCMAVCPYSHPDNLLHAGVRLGIRNNTLFRRVALWMDDLVYGRQPTPKDDLEWMRAPESKG